MYWNLNHFRVSFLLRFYFICMYRWILFVFFLSLDNFVHVSVRMRCWCLCNMRVYRAQNTRYVLVLIWSAMDGRSAMYLYCFFFFLLLFLCLSMNFFSIFFFFAFFNSRFYLFWQKLFLFLLSKISPLI